MKVLITGTSYFPEYSAGTEVYMRLMAQHLTAAGDSVVIACGGKPAVPASGGKWGVVELLHEGIPILRIIRHPERAALADPYLLQDEERRQVWEEILSRTDPDIVFTIGPGPSQMGDVEIIAHAQGRPVVTTLIHPGQVCPNGSRIDQTGHGCMKTMERMLCGRCVVEEKLRMQGAFLAANALGAPLLNLIPVPGRIATLRRLPRLIEGFIDRWHHVRKSVQYFVAHSDAAYELLVANGVRKDQIVFSTPGFEVERTEQPARQVVGRVRFGFVGRLCREKGVLTLLKAWQMQQPDLPVELHLWGNPASGDADVVEAVMKLEQEDPRVRFHGPFNREQTFEVYQSMDVLVVPSEWFDNCPFVIWEAFAAGVPVIGSDFGGISTMISDGVDGRLFPMSDADALAAVIREMSDVKMMQGMCDNVRPPRDVREHVADMRALFERCRAAKIGEPAGPNVVT